MRLFLKSLIFSPDISPSEAASLKRKCVDSHESGDSARKKAKIDQDGFARILIGFCPEMELYIRPYSYIPTW